jgi:hypothetical protein
VAAMGGSVAEDYHHPSHRLTTRLLLRLQIYTFFWEFVHDADAVSDLKKMKLML